MGFRASVQNARLYLHAETARLANPDAAAQTIPTFTVLRGVTLNPDGTANVPIEQGHGARLIDAPIVFVCELAICHGARLRLNSRGLKAAGEANVYPRLDVRGGGNTPRLNMQLNRLVGDPGPGWTVKENPADHRNHLREGLRMEERRLEFGPGKSRTTRLEAIEAILQAFDRAIPATLPFITRDEFGELLMSLLLLADHRSAERTNLKRAA